MLDKGKKIKNSVVTVTDGSQHKLKQMCGKAGMVLYFYPRDNTPGCTTEACDFRDNLLPLKKLGYSIVGVSADSTQSHQKFTEKKEINFELVSDSNYELCNEFGVYGEKKFMGKTHMGIIRSTFILDKNLEIIKSYPQVKVKDHVAQIIKDLKAMS